MNEPGQEKQETYKRLAEIKRAITQGVRRDGTKLKPPMGYPYYAKMTDGDVDAMVAYLRTVPPKE